MKHKWPTTPTLEPMDCLHGCGTRRQKYDASRWFYDTLETMGGMRAPPCHPRSTLFNAADKHGLYTIGHNARFGWAAITGGKFARRTAMRLIERGLAVSAWDVFLVDDSGFMKDPERCREGFEFTPFGELVEAKLEADAQAKFEAQFAAEDGDSLTKEKLHG